MSDLLDTRIVECRTRLMEEPESGVFVLLADLLRERGDFDDALAVLAEGAVHRPESLAAGVVLGRTLLEAGQVEDARGVLEKVLAADRDNVVALRLLAEDCRSRADWSEAMPYLARLAELEPQEERWPAALEEARAFRDAPPRPEGEAEAGFATLTLVDIYLAQGYQDRAITALKQMLVADPGREDVRARLEAMDVQEIGIPREEMTGDPEAEQEEEVDEAAKARNKRRLAHKQHFTAWIEKLARDEEASP